MHRFEQSLEFTQQVLYGTFERRILAGRDEFISGRENPDHRVSAHRNLGESGRSDHSDIQWRDNASGRQQPGTLPVVGTLLVD